MPLCKASLPGIAFCGVPIVEDNFDFRGAGSDDPIKSAKFVILSVRSGSTKARRPDIKRNIGDFIGKEELAGADPTR